MRIGLIVNPLSHTVRRRGSVLEQVRARLPDVHFVRIDEFASLPEQITRLAGENVSAVFVEGGDGTLQAVLSVWPGLADGTAGPPEFAILPGGSTNLAYKVAGLRRCAVEDVILAITAISSGSPVTRMSQPALRVESAALGSPLVGMLLSTGSLARAMIYTQTQIHGGGHRGSRAIAEAAARFVFSPQAYLDSDGAPLLRASELTAQSAAFRFHGPHTLSLMTTLPSLSLGLKPFWGDGRGWVHFTHAAWPLNGFRVAFLKILAGQAGPHMKRHGLTSCRIDAVSLTYKGPVVLDGELLPVPEDGSIKVSATSPLRFLR